MHKVSFYIVLFFLASTSYSQLTIKPIVATQSSFVREPAQNIKYDTSWILPFWDDFSEKGPQLDTTKWSIGQDVTINNTFTVNTPTAYVASFDGVDANGRPYSNNSTFNGAGDSLVSQRIVLSTVPTSQRSTVYLSFFYQLKGLGEIPDEKDSLQLQFYAKDSTWYTVDLTPDDPTGFALKGGNDNLVTDEEGNLYFRQVFVPVTDQKYYHQNFKFKFISYSSLSGIYDTWNIDYVYINQNRSPDRTDHRDRSVSGHPSALFFPFNAIPANQYTANPELYNSAQTITLSNLEDGVFTIEFNHTLTNTNTGEFITTGPKNDAGQVGFRSVEFGREVRGRSPLNLPVSGDSVVVTSEFYYSTGDSLLYEILDIEGRPLYSKVDLKVNDTLRTNYYLTDYYAYDDGSAEFAAGINLLGGKLAVKYWVNEPDTLTSIAVYFPSINPSSVGQTIDLAVWTGLDPEIEQRRQSFTIAQSTRDQMTRIDLSTPLVVKDTFYIGYVQFTDNYIGIGLDKNNIGGSEYIYSNTDRQWTQNTRIEGSLMMRPVFASGADYVLDIDPSPVQEKVIIYPNPASGYISIRGDFDGFDIFDFSGKIIERVDSKAARYDLTNLKEGLYFLQIYQKDVIIRKKLVIKK